ncbi:pentapeptide repeat-containing protein [Chloroflexota bacterium]
MREGTKESPYTREVVLSLIKENGGKASNLDLSERVFEEGINLTGLDLNGIILRGGRFPTHFEDNQLVGAKFDGSELIGADLRGIDFQYAQFKILTDQPTCLATANLRGSSFSYANFQGADLTATKFGENGKAEKYSIATLDITDFRGAKLFRTSFKGCYFYGTKFQGAYIRGIDIADAHLEEADWGNYLIGEELSGDFYDAEHYYRKLKVWYAQSGYDGIAAKFYYREKEAQRKSLRFYYCEKEVRKKSLKLLPRNWKHRIALQFSYWVFGHGEGWKRLLFWILGVILGLSLVYFFFRGVSPFSFNVQSFLNSLYYSAVSFTALGYGSWAPEPTIWAKGLGAFESLVGVFTMALLLVTFVRKWTR